MSRRQKDRGLQIGRATAISEDVLEAFKKDSLGCTARIAGFLEKCCGIGSCRDCRLLVPDHTCGK